MFPGYSKFCLWLDEKGLDINSAFIPAIYTVMLMIAVFSLQYTHNTGKDCWDIVVAALVFCLILVFVWIHFFCGHPCIKVQKVKDYSVDVKAVKQKVGEYGLRQHEFETAFNGTDEELKYIVDYVRNLIKEHIRDVPMFERVWNKRYTGRIWFFNNHSNAVRVWTRHYVCVGSAAGFHNTASNINYIYVPGHSYVQLVKTVLHECIHSFVTDESVTTFATLYLLLKFGTPEEKAFAASQISRYCHEYEFGCYTQYSYCIWYFNKYLT